MVSKSSVIEAQTYQIVAGTVRNVVNQFLIERSSRRLSKSTLTYYQRYLGEFYVYLDTIGVLNIDELTPDILRKYMLYLEGAGHNPGGVHGYYRCIRALLAWWEEETDGDFRSPMRKVKPPKLEVKPLPGIQLEDAMKMVEACKGRLEIRDEAILLVLLDTGARRAEFLNLNVGQVDLNTGETTIFRGKGGKFRSVFLGAQSRRTLKKYLKTRPEIQPDSPLFVTSDEKRISFDGLKSIIRRRAAAAGVKAPGLHDFRRCFALSMKRNGADVVTISRMLGHTSLEVTKRYLAQDSTDFKKAHERFGPVDHAGR